MYIGRKFHRWTVLEEPKPYRGVLRVKVECQCGTIRHIALYTLLKNKSQSCGCIHRRVPNPVIGQHIHRLTILKEYKIKYQKFVKVKCSCGTVKVVLWRNVYYGKTTSCGCHQKKRTKEVNTHRGILITYKGVTQSVIEWSQKFRIPPSTLYYRIKQGWPLEEVFYDRKEST